ncbi:MAG: hypothetical protein JW704_04500 [Anaerolineaceae bacterium]|nr:hypothetical protein [Anaerolineaceae bacterium]
MFYILASMDLADQSSREVNTQMAAGQQRDNRGGTGRYDNNLVDGNVISKNLILSVLLIML